MARENEKDKDEKIKIDESQKQPKEKLNKVVEKEERVKKQIESEEQVINIKAVFVTMRFSCLTKNIIA